MNDLPIAEELNYWQTSRSSPDSWIEKARRQIEKLDGTVLAEGFGSEPTSGRSAYMLAFEIQGDQFKVVWPVLPTKTGNEQAARRQAATMLYHDIKAKCLTAKVMGIRSAFFSYLMLPDGRVAAQLAAPEIANSFPPLLIGGNST